MNDGFTLTIAKHIATITLDNPDKRNAFDDQLINGLQGILEHLETDVDVRVVILRANGKHFSAGADLNWMKSVAKYSEAENYDDACHLAKLMYTLNQLSKPTIALVEGAAYGGGVGLIACCDIVIATLKASFCFSEVRLGLVPAVISPYVISVIGERAARRYFLTAEAFGAERAHELGLVSEIETAGQIEQRCDELCTHLLANGPKAVVEAKALIQEIANKKIDECLIDITAKRIARIRVSDEGQEGLNAFLEKRAPNFS